MRDFCAHFYSKRDCIAENTTTECENCWSYFPCHSEHLYKTLFIKLCMTVPISEKLFSEVNVLIETKMK